MHKKSACQLSNKNRPQIHFKDGGLYWDNFPAYSSDGKYVLSIQHNISCCISTSYELQMIETKKGTVEKKIVLIPTLDIDSDTFTKEKNKKILYSVRHLLNDKKYYALDTLGSYDLVTDSLTSKAHINFKHNNKKWRSNDFVLEVVRKGFCCTGIADDTTTFTMPPDQIQIWYALQKKILLIECGLTSGANGCDSGPFCKIVYIKPE